MARPPDAAATQLICETLPAPPGSPQDSQDTPHGSTGLSILPLASHRPTLLSPLLPNLPVSRTPGSSAVLTVMLLAPGGSHFSEQLQTGGQD
ncbi:hypothetical protein Cadr_000010827 [Camelus dromedarius]|uniref:Uncharacterized protein n=1 Tax=Camelus dromedarius TaxID=9838 RepID=A0A5N4DRW2_CAMDR|nr:hypothetical protein Cadr_000010827 [Camelus dromedarius]